MIYAEKFIAKVDAAFEKGSPIILSWELAEGLRKELEAVAEWILQAKPDQQEGGQHSRTEGGG